MFNGIQFVLDLDSNNTWNSSPVARGTSAAVIAVLNVTSGLTLTSSNLGVRSSVSIKSNPNHSNPLYTSVNSGKTKTGLEQALTPTLLNFGEAAWMHWTAISCMAGKICLAHAFSWPFVSLDPPIHQLNIRNYKLSYLRCWRKASRDHIWLKFEFFVADFCTE